MAEAETLEVVRCSMCLKNIGHCRYLVHSPHANVCDECVQLSYKILVDNGTVSKWELLRLLFRRTT
ncbi:MAG: ClpX C4-type zinc finger protein [Polyangiales bacterium]